MDGAGRAVPGAVDVSSLLKLHGPHAAIILALFLLAQALLAFPGGGELNHTDVAVLAFVPFGIAAIWVVQPAPDPLPGLWCVGILGLCTLTVTVLSAQPAIAGSPLYLTWHLGAVTTVLFMLILRGRVLYGWLGYVGMAAATLLWAVTGGLGAMAGVELLVRHAATLVVGTAIYFGLLRTAKRISAINSRALAEAAADATALAAEEERVAQLARLDEMARPMMELVARGQQLSAAERRDCLMIEASLRDIVRGRALAVPHVLAAARAARERGVEVTLLDDSAAAGTAGAVAELLARELRTLDSGTLTARLQPAGRTELATIVISPLAGDARMLIVDRDGRVR
ncbi:hypothetical protein EV379_2651 [Microterricola gilva]|uniref:Signal transduction histidine kinase n=2 Tax=Microterricola gilva TaxID=393267 RepID=A0A4Q8ANW2_9MICO|nr:hypothetical protein EV379_2651 [Microterricola gilva]